MAAGVGGVAGGGGGGGAAGGGGSGLGTTSGYIRTANPRLVAGGARPVSMSNVMRTGPTTFTDLADDALLQVGGFLTAAELARFQATCRRAADVGRQPDLWDALLARDFLAGATAVRRPGRPVSGRMGAAMASMRDMTSAFLARTAAGDGGAVNNSGSRLSAPSTRTVAAGGAGGDAGPKAVYRTRYLAHRASIDHARRSMERRVKEAAAVERGNRLRVGLDCAGYGVGLAAPCALLALWLLLLLLKLSGTSAGLSWGAVWTPVWVTAVVFTTCLCFGLGVNRCARRATSESAWYQQEDGEQYTLGGVAAAMMGRLGRGTCGCVSRVGWLAMNLLLAFVVFPALVYAKLDGLITASWPAVFTPVWLIFGLWCCMPAALSRLIEERDAIMGIWSITVVVVWAPLLTTLAMVVARLEGRAIEAVFIFIPLYVVDAGIILALCMLCIVFCVDDDERRKAGAGIAALCILLGIFLPSQIMASITDHRTGAFPVVGTLAPLVAGMFIVALLAGCGAFVACAVSRSDHFRDAYSWAPWCRCLRRPTAVVLPGAGGRAAGGRGPAFDAV